jgi:hypothetical protein
MPKINPAKHLNIPKSAVTLNEGEPPVKGVKGGPKKYLITKKKLVINNNVKIMPFTLIREKYGTKKGKIIYTHHSVLNDQDGVFKGGVL